MILTPLSSTKSTTGQVSTKSSAGVLPPLSSIKKTTTVEPITQQKTVSAQLPTNLANNNLPVTTLNRPSTPQNTLQSFWNGVKNTINNFISPVDIVKDQVNNNLRKEVAKINDMKPEQIPIEYIQQHREAITKELGIRDAPTTPEVTSAVFNVALLGGLLALGEPGVAVLPAITKMASGLAGFTATSELINAGVSKIKKEKYVPFYGNGLADLLPTDTSDSIKNGVELLQFALQAKAFKLIEKKAPNIAEFLTKDIVAKYNLPETVSLDKDVVRQFYVDDTKLDPKIRQSIIDLNLSKVEIRDAVKNGLTIDLPWQKVTTIMDKPYWSKIKSIFKVPTSAEVSVTTGLNKPTSKVGNVKGFLTAGEYTPEEIRTKVINTPLEKTPDGRTLLKASIQAEQTGGKIQIGDLARLQNFNKAQSERNTNALREATLSGQRETERIDNEANIKKFKLYNQQFNKDGITPDTQVDIYRWGTGEIKPGDQVTVTKSRAESYSQLRAGGELLIGKAKLADLVFNDGPKSKGEFVLAPKESVTKSKAVKEKRKKITLYRGTGKMSPLEGNYFTPDKEYAREFLGTGRPEELKKVSVPLSDIYKPKVLPETTSEEQMTKAINEARSKGFKAVFASEGGTDKPSVFYLDKVSRDFYDKFSPSKGVGVEGIDPLIEEARKYKSADKFINSQEKIFRGVGGPKDPNVMRDTLGQGRYFSKSIDVAKEYGKVEESFTTGLNIKEFKDINEYKDFVQPIYLEMRSNSPIWDGTLTSANKIMSEAKVEANKRLFEQGFDGVSTQIHTGENLLVVFPDSIPKVKSKLELNNIYNQATVENKQAPENNLQEGDKVIYKGEEYKFIKNYGVSGDKRLIEDSYGVPKVVLPNEITKKDSVSGVDQYGMSHRPTETGATADNITQEVSDMGLPKDFYQHPEYYANMDDLSYKESFRVLTKIKGKPNAEVTIYRASPRNELNRGDWVTLSKNYAKGESLTENTPVHKFKVKAKDIQFAGDDINEFGYYPKDTQKIDTTSPKPLETPIKTSPVSNVSEGTVQKPKIQLKDISSPDQIKNIENVKSELTKISENYQMLTDEIKGVAKIAEEQRSGLDTASIAKLKRIYSKSRQFQEGDIETIRNSKWGGLVNTVIENIQVKYPQMSEQEAFDFALQLPTKAETFIKTSPEIKALLKEKQKLDESLNLLLEKQKSITGDSSISLDQLNENNQAFNEWKKALNTQAEINKIVVTPENANKASKLPVEQATGKTKVSKAYSRILDSLTELADADPTYKQYKMAEQASLAEKFVNDYPERALNIARGLEPPPPDVLDTAISIAVSTKSLEEGKYKDYANQYLSRSQRQTRRGQEIVFEKTLNSNSTDHFMGELVKARMELASSKRGWVYDKVNKAKNYAEGVKREVSKVKEQINKAVFNKLESAQKLIDSLTCKI